jgi:hypothetical protein
VAALWREALTYHPCHATAGDLIQRVATCAASANATPDTVADRLWVKKERDPTEKTLRLSN